MKISLKLTTVALLATLNMLGQSDTSKSLGLSFLTNNVNAGVSFGLGGVHPQLVMPTFIVKLGRFKLKGIGWDKPRAWPHSYSDGGFEVGVDAVELPRTNPNSTKYLSLGIGGMRYNSLFQNKEWYQFHNFMVGVSNYNHGKRGVLEAKIGLAIVKKYLATDEIDRFDRPYISNERMSRRLLPYAGISYSLYLAKFQKTSLFDWETKSWKLNTKVPFNGWSWKKGGGLIKKYDSEADSLLAARRRYMVSNYFNLGLNFGLGGGRLDYVLPSLSLKLGPLSLKGAIRPSDEILNYAWQSQLNLFKIKRHRFWTNTDMYPVISVGVSNFVAYDEKYAFRNYELLGGLNFEKSSKN